MGRTDGEGATQSPAESHVMMRGNCVVKWFCIFSFVTLLI